MQGCSGSINSVEPLPLVLALALNEGNITYRQSIFVQIDIQSRDLGQNHSEKTWRFGDNSEESNSLANSARDCFDL